MKVPAVVVDGTGAVALPVPPIGTVYQSNAVPVAVSWVAVTPWQYVNGPLPTGAGGNETTDTTREALGPSQVPTV